MGEQRRRSWCNAEGEQLLYASDKACNNSYSFRYIDIWISACRNSIRNSHRGAYGKRCDDIMAILEAMRPTLSASNASNADVELFLTWQIISIHISLIKDSCKILLLESQVTHEHAVCQRNILLGVHLSLLLAERLFILPCPACATSSDVQQSESHHERWHDGSQWIRAHGDLGSPGTHSIGYEYAVMEYTCIEYVRTGGYVIGRCPWPPRCNIFSIRWRSSSSQCSITSFAIFHALHRVQYLFSFVSRSLTHIMPLWINTWPLKSATGSLLWQIWTPISRTRTVRPTYGIAFYCISKTIGYSFSSIFIYLRGSILVLCVHLGWAAEKLRAKKTGVSVDYTKMNTDKSSLVLTAVWAVGILGLFFRIFQVQVLNQWSRLVAKIFSSLLI